MSYKGMQPLGKLTFDIAEMVSRFEREHGVRVSINDGIGLSIGLRCPGRDSDMGYYCCLQSGHEGRCHSREKSVWFRPVGHEAQS